MDAVKPAAFVLFAAATLLQGATTAPEAGAENPIVREIFTADPAALVADGRLYVYTGRDEATPAQNNFVMREWHAFPPSRMARGIPGSRWCGRRSTRRCTRSPATST
jgi:hypothetical protein